MASDNDKKTVSKALNSWVPIKIGQCVGHLEFEASKLLQSDGTKKAFFST